MAKAGADLVGLNCLFDPSILLDVMADMKKALDLSNLHPYLMVQPLGNNYLSVLQKLYVHGWIFFTLYVFLYSGAPICEPISTLKLGI